MKVCEYVRSAALLACLAVLPSSGRAQDRYAVGDMGQSVTVSEASFRQMNEELQALKASFAEAKKEEKKDEWVDTHGEKWTTKFGGRVHMDYTNYAGQNADSFSLFKDQQDSAAFRRMYLFFEGEGYGIYEYKFEIDFADTFSAAGTSATGGATTTSVPGVRLKDVYVGIKELPVLGTVRFGHFKIPQSMETLTSSRYISLTERSLPISAFCPERELGAAAYRVSDSENATLSYGLFFDSLDERLKQTVNDKQGATFAARGTWTPYYDEPSQGRYLVHTGVGYKYTDSRSDTVSFSARPETWLQSATIGTGTINTRDWNTLSLEGAAVWGPLSVQSEFFYVPVKDKTAGIQRDFYGAYVMGSWFLTGENRNYKRTTGAFDRVSPYENFWAISGAGIGSGAWEALARWSYLDLSGTSNTLSGMQNDFTAGLTWYWNPQVKWMFDYIHSWDTYTNNTKKPENDILAISCRLDF